MNTFKIVGRPDRRDAWLHRFRNFGEAVYVRLRDETTVDLHEIDAATDTFHVRDVPPARVAAIRSVLEQLRSEHFLDHSVTITSD
ncbi:MAG TPA: hypothetical protein VKB93_21010 [Thermoanaerobaculia bacterium]|nr:hypothetical protein [Thermoanaerobaculia bacterium]